MSIERLEAADLVDPQLPVSERTKKNQRWPKDQVASETPHSHGFVARAYEDALVLEAMPSRFRGMASVFGMGLLVGGILSFRGIDLGTRLISAAFDKSGFGLLLVLTVALFLIVCLMVLVAFIAAIRVFRIDLLAPKQIPVVFNRRMRKVYRYAQDIPGFEEMFNAQGKFSLLGVLRYIVSTFRPWPNMILVEYDWDCLEAEYYSVTAMAGNVVRTDYHVELFVREAPGSDKVIGAFALMPSILASEEMGRDLWEHVRRFMEEHGPALSPGDQPAAPPPKGFWQALDAPAGAAWILFAAGIAWTAKDMYWSVLSQMKGWISQALWERALYYRMADSPFGLVIKGFVIFGSYFGGGWVFFGVLASYLSRGAELPADIVRECGSPIDLKKLAEVQTLPQVP